MLIPCRNLKRLALAAGLGALLIGLHIVGAAPALAQFGSVSITTDKTAYSPGDQLWVCYTVVVPGFFTITDTQANGGSHVFFAGLDDGTGGCLAGTVTPPSGNECLSIVAGGGSAQACFQVLGQTPPSQQCGTVSVLNGHVTSSGAQQMESCFYQAYQQCSPAGLLFTDAQIDAGTKYEFQVQSNGGFCSIIEGVQHYTLPIPPGQPPKLGSCVGVTQTPSGLLFIACQGGGNVLVPNS
jgi:hypothetical protein